MILVRVTNRGAAARTLQPRLIVDTTLEFALRPEAQLVTVNAHETSTASLQVTGLAETNGARRAIRLEALTVPPGASAAFFVLYSGGGTVALEPTTVKQTLAARDRAVSYWANAPLPLDRVQVPDPGIQALVDSSIRNIWQAREIKRGLPAFQVGPTCYRGLWIVETATLEVKPLAAHCRAMVVHLPDGGTRAIPPQQGGTVTFSVTPPAGTAPANRG